MSIGFSRRIVALLVTACSLTFALPAANAQPVHVKDAEHAVTYSPHMQQFSCFMNLGPTGAKAWMRGYQFVITSIQQGSPSFGKLELGDVIVGVNGKTFSEASDHRMDLGNAIGEAERTGQPLKLNVLRKMQPVEVLIDLPESGGYSATWPYDCEKSTFQLERACEALMDVQMPKGVVPSDGRFGSFNAGLLWLAADDPRYLDAVRRCIHDAMRVDYDSMSLNNWAMGYASVLMAEYYLATGDDTVLPKLQEVIKLIEAGQMVCGSWGHKSPAGGYGALNQPGLVCAMALVLAKECGVEVDQQVLDKALNFFRRFAGVGCVPYGDGNPYRALDDNGKNSMAAVLFHLAGEDEIARQFGEDAGDSYWLRERGHTGPYFSFMWGPIAVKLTAPEKFRKFMDYQNWYYNLGTEWDGAMTILPYAEALTRFDSNSYIGEGHRFSTGGLALTYALPMKKLRLTGAPQSVFSVNAKLSDELKEARKLYLARDWKAFDKAIAAIDPDTLESDNEQYWFNQLRDARAFSLDATEHLIKVIENNRREGAPYLALLQLEALEKTLGKLEDPRLLKLQEKLNEPSIQWQMRGGKKHADRLEDIEFYTILTWYPEGIHTRDKLAGTPTARRPFWEPLSPTTELESPTWKTKLYQTGATPETGWQEIDFDDSTWTEREGILTHFDAEEGQSLPTGPIAARRTFVIDDLDDMRSGKLRARIRTVRRTTTQVYLNGELLVDLERGQRGGYATIPLNDSTFDLLKEGENVLAVTAGSQGKANNHLDVAVELNRRGMLPEHRPIHRAKNIQARYLPQDVTTDLLVSRTTRAYQQRLQEGYENQSVEQLVSDMGNPRALYRLMIANALVKKGPQGVRAAIARLDDADWRVTSTALDVIAKALPQLKAENNVEALAMLKATIPTIAKQLGNEQAWVRTQACRTLEKFGTDAKSAAPQIIAVATDEEQWVRRAAVAALLAMDIDQDTILATVEKAVATQTPPRRLVSDALKATSTSKDDPKSLAILLAVLRNPPDLAGGVLNETVKRACELDPQGKEMIPLLIEAAQHKNAFGNQKGNPRKMAIEALAVYGSQAKPAAAVLEAIIADDSDEAKQLHEAAQTTLDAINAG